MNAIRIHKHLDSDTLHLPELRPLLGRQVDIIVLADSNSSFAPRTGDWDAAAQAVRGLQDFDYKALIDQDSCDRKHAHDHVP